MLKTAVVTVVVFVFALSIFAAFVLVVRNRASEKS